MDYRKHFDNPDTHVKEMMAPKSRALRNSDTKKWVNLHPHAFLLSSLVIGYNVDRLSGVFCGDEKSGFKFSYSWRSPPLVECSSQIKYLKRSIFFPEKKIYFSQAIWLECFHIHRFALKLLLSNDDDLKKTRKPCRSWLRRKLLDQALILWSLLNVVQHKVSHLGGGDCKQTWPELKFTLASAAQAN